MAALKKRLKLWKKSCANPSMINKEELNSYSKYWSEIITDAKDKFLNRLSVKLDDPNTSAKSYWSIINNFLQQKNSYYTTSLLSDSNFRFKIKS